MPAKSKDSGSCCCGSALAKVLIVAAAVVIVAAIVIGLSFAGRSAGGNFAGVFQNQYENQRTITLTASGSASASPDMAEVMIAMNGTGPTAAMANANLSASVGVMNRTILPFLNGNTSLIQTTSYQISPATNCTYPAGTSTAVIPYYCITHKLPYYVASESLEISVPNIRNSSAVITGLSKVPNIQLQGVQAAFSQGLQNTLNQKALSAALANATGQAQLLAGQGVSISVENITVQSGLMYYPEAYGTLSIASSPAVAANSTAFYGGKGTTQRSIHVVFGIR
jgi:uncharacterized protein YggE